MMHLCGEVDTEDMEGTADMEDMEVYTEQQMHLCWRHWILTFLETRSTHLPHFTTSDTLVTGK